MQVSTATATADGLESSVLALSLSLSSSVYKSLLRLIDELLVVEPVDERLSCSRGATPLFLPTGPDRPTDRDVQSRVVPPRGTSWLEDLRPLRLKQRGV